MNDITEKKKIALRKILCLDENHRIIMELSPLFRISSPDPNEDIRLYYIITEDEPAFKNIIKENWNSTTVDDTRYWYI